MLRRLIERVRRDEDGAVTVDWMVLTAGILIFGVMVAAAISRGTTDMSSGAGARLAAAQVPTITW